MEGGGSDDIADFINRFIESVAQLEALLLLRSDPSVSWDVSALSRRLYIQDNEAAEVLKALVASGLVQDNGGSYRYAARPELAIMVDRLAEAYSRELIKITNLIHTRNRRIRQFADAFKFRKDS